MVTALDLQRERALAALQADVGEHTSWHHRCEALELVVLNLVNLVHDAAQRDGEGVARLDGAEFLANLAGQLAGNVALRLDSRE